MLSLASVCPGCSIPVVTPAAQWPGCSMWPSGDHIIISSLSSFRWSYHHCHHCHHHCYDHVIIVIIVIIIEMIISSYHHCHNHWDDLQGRRHQDRAPGSGAQPRGGSAYCGECVQQTDVQVRWDVFRWGETCSGELSFGGWVKNLIYWKKEHSFLIQLASCEFVILTFVIEHI